MDPPSVSTETSRLFPGFRSRSTAGRTTATTTRKRTNGGSWTAKFLCVSANDQEKTPTCTEKDILYRTGLGLKKIKVNNSLNEEEVIQLLQSEQGFLKLKDCGGFELLRTLQNGRHLVPVPSPWTSKALKMNVGPQARIYIRPIQHSLPVEPVLCDEGPTMNVACDKCKVVFSVHDLRNHIIFCGVMETELQPSDNIWSGVSDLEQPIPSVNVNDIVIQSELPLSDNIWSGVSDLEQPIPSVNVNDIVIESELPLSDNISSGVDDLEQPIPSVNASIVQTENVGVTSTKEIPIDEIVTMCISLCSAQNISEPVAILRIYQDMIMTGRALDVDQDSEISGLDGETNFIMINRNNVVQTAVEEVRYITDMRKCLEVQFYGEAAVDYGGPRKEFFRLVLQQIRQDYFDPVREWSKDYEVIGKIMALSMVQNGKLPRVMSSELVEEVFFSSAPRPFVQDLRNGLDSLGLIQLTNGCSTFMHLFTPSQPAPLTHKMVTQLLIPLFSLEGSNRRRQESLVYSSFLKYLREAASGRRGPVSLGCILQFATGADEEPVLGFRLQPSINFAEKQNFLPSANTCINKLILAIPSSEMDIPPQEQLYTLYDYAFTNTYFGLE